MARRLRATRVRNGTLTNVTSRTIDGSGKQARAEWNSRSVEDSSSALSSSTRTRALRVATTQSGS